MSKSGKSAIKKSGKRGKKKRKRKLSDEEIAERRRAYFARWYAKNKKRVSERRRRLYREDPEYRAKVHERTRRWRQRKAEERKLNGEDQERRPFYIDVEYEDGRVETGISSGEAIEILGVHRLTFYNWLRRGVIPQTPYRTDGGKFVWTEKMIREVARAVEKHRGDSKYLRGEAMAKKVREEIERRWGKLKVCGFAH